MDTGPASDPSAARGQSSAVIGRQARPTGGAPGKGRETRPAGRGAGKGSAIADANGKGKRNRKGKGKGVAQSSRSSRGGGGEGDGEGDSYSTLGKLVSKATTPSRETGYKYLDEDAVRRIKAIARTGDECAAGALRYLMQRMAAKSAEVRFMALAIVGQLFQRSRVVRAVLVADLKNFINLAVGHDPRQPLPGPPAAATALREKALALMEEWNEAHGQLYKGLRAAYRFLREAKRMKFPELQAQAARQREAAARKSKHAQRLLRAKYMQAKGEIAEQVPEIEGLLREMEECFGILVPVVPGTDAISHAETTDGPGGVAPDAPDASSSSRATSSSRDGTLAGGGGGYEGGDGGGGGGDGGRGGGGGNSAITRAEQAEGRGGERDSQARGGGAAEAAAETAMGAAVTQLASTNTGAAIDDGDDFDDGDGDGDDDDDDDEGMEWEDGGGGGGGDSEEEKEEEEEGEEEEGEGGGGKRRRSRGADAGAGAPRTIADTVEAAGLGSRGYELQVEVPVGWSWTIGADGGDGGGGGGGSGGDGGGDDVALVVTALRERYKVLTSRLLPLLSDWIQTLSRVQFDPEEKRRPSDTSSSSSSSSSSRKEPHDRGATTTPTTTTTTVTPDPLATPASSVERRTCAGLLSRCLATRNAANALASKFVELKIDDAKEIGGGGGGERGSSTGRGHRGRGHENGSTAAAAAAPGVGKGKGGAGGGGGGGREGGGWEWGSTTAWRAPVSTKPRLQIRLQS